MPPNRNIAQDWKSSSGRLRHLIWNGYHDEARRELYGMRHMASEVVYLNGERFRSPIGKLLWHCDDLWRYLTNNVEALINYGRGTVPSYRSRPRGRRAWMKSPTLAWPRSSACDGPLGERTVSRQFAQQCWTADSGRKPTSASQPDQNFSAPQDKSSVPHRNRNRHKSR